MTLLTLHPASAGPPRVRLEPIQDHHAMFDGRWWPRSNDLEAELPPLVGVLDGVRGPVVRLLLSAVGWKRRPHHVIVADRKVGIGYFSGQAPTILIAICADGAVLNLLVVPAGPAVPGRAGCEDAWENEGGARNSPMTPLGSAARPAIL